jgi:hypothetical protein
MTPLDPTFACFACHHDFGPNDANLDAQNNLNCGKCYVADPPIVDVEIIFAQMCGLLSAPARDAAPAPVGLNFLRLTSTACSFG